MLPAIIGGAIGLCLAKLIQMKYKKSQKWSWKLKDWIKYIRQEKMPAASEKVG